jgi:hypothetical protein
MYDTMRIRAKLIRALVLPLLALVAMAGVVVGRSAEDADRAARQATAIREAQANGDVEALRQAAEQEATDAENRRGTDLLAAGFVVVLAAGVALAASRSIARPLLRLAREAGELSEQRLPATVTAILETPKSEEPALPELQPVTTGGGAEIDQVAQALNSLQATAAQLAVDQAVLRRTMANTLVIPDRRATRPAPSENGADERFAPPAATNGDEPVTAAGYKRRQRGTHAPRTDVAAAYRRATAAANGEDAPDTGDAPEDKADAVRDLLSGLQAGAERARAEQPAADEPPPDDEAAQKEEES